MSELRIYPEDGSGSPRILNDPDEIAQRLDAIGVLFERWAVRHELDGDAGQDEIIEAYRQDIDRLMQRYGFRSLDVVSFSPEHPKKDTLRRKFLQEHTHSDFEMRFFVAGEALFYLRKHDHVYGLLCTRGDLISIPTDITHWFDMGEQPRLTAIRLFREDGGGASHFTGDPISERFPSLEETAGGGGL